MLALNVPLKAAHPAVWRGRVAIMRPSFQPIPGLQPELQLQRVAGAVHEEASSQGPEAEDSR